ncbi:MAG: ATP-binding cassette domain-containing protein, partial [Alphaproteobacteria bacterium]|nr:ATP-binding cassette domain-containing protein [Alphaproteobacteria bacterium]
MSLRLKDFEVTLKGETLIGPLSLEVEGGDILSVMGPSGSGKSSLLNAIIGEIAFPFSVTGQVFVDDLDVGDLPVGKRKIGILYQDDLLFPHMTVGENLLFAIPQQYSSHDREKLMRQALSDAHLEGFENRDPATLSGGQRARVSCMRMLLSQPQAILLDEPFSKLDADLKERFRRFVFDLGKDRN